MPSMLISETSPANRRKSQIAILPMQGAPVAEYVILLFVCLEAVTCSTKLSKSRSVCEREGRPQNTVGVGVLP